MDKVFFVGKNIIPYNIKEHLPIIGVFLYWSDNNDDVYYTDQYARKYKQLNNDDGICLYCADDRQYKHHRNLLSVLLNKKRVPKNVMPNGAGSVDKKKIFLWYSFEYEISTEEEEEERIENLLGISY